MMRAPIMRHEKNPLITPKDMPFECYSVMNAGAVYYNNGVLLLLRVEDHTRSTNFYTAWSSDGISFKVNEKPIVYPLSETEKRFGACHRFDMRITPMDGTYYVLHAAWLGKFGCCIGMAQTDDFETFRPFPYISEPSNRNAVLFPEKINGYYARLDRPQNCSTNGETWISYSNDLHFWGNSMPIAIPETPWNTGKNGAGAIPIKTDKGWLEIYHATAETVSTINYYLGVILLDLEDPSIVVAAPRQFILAAVEPYECVGQTPNVVFTSGAVVMPDGTLNIYYGGADTCICVAQSRVEDLVRFCLENGLCCYSVL